MKKLVVTLLVLGCFAMGYGQGSLNQSDGGVPIGQPPPEYSKRCNGVPYNPKKQQCTCMCGVIAKNDTCTETAGVWLSTASRVLRPGNIATLNCRIYPATGQLKVSVGGELQLLSNADDPNIYVRGTGAGKGWVIANYTLCDKTLFDRYDIEVSDKVTVTGTDTIFACSNTIKTSLAAGYPGGGIYSWKAGEGVTIFGASDQEIVEFSCDSAGAHELTVTYTSGKESAYHTVNVLSDNPFLSMNLPDTINKAIGERFYIKPTIKPGASNIVWYVSDGLTLNSDPYNYIAFVTVNYVGSLYRKVTFKATICGEVYVKTVVVKVDPCSAQLNVPDSLVILAGASGSVTATGNTKGSYNWVVNGPLEIKGTNKNQTVTINGLETGTGWGEVTFTADDCQATRHVKLVVIDKPVLTIEVQHAPMDNLCINERRTLVATCNPAGGKFTWSLSSGALKFYGRSGNVPAVAVEARSGGDCKVTCTYTVNGQTTSVTLDATVHEYSKLKLFANLTDIEVKPDAAVTYTAKAYDQNGQLVATPPLNWRVIYVPVGRENNAANWMVYDLPGNGSAQTYIWKFPQDMRSLPGKPPYKMEAWIEATEYCNFRSGNYPVTIVKDDSCNISPKVSLDYGNTQFQVKKISNVHCRYSPPGGQLTVTVNGNLQLLSVANDPNIQVKRTAAGKGSITVKYTVCGKTVTDSCDIDLKKKIPLVVADTLLLCTGKTNTTEALGNEGAGLYAWKAGEGVTIIGPSDQPKVKFITDAPGAGTLTVTYTATSGSYFHTTRIRSVEPAIKFNLPDTVNAINFQNFIIAPSFNQPPGKLNWTATEGLTLNADPKYGAFISVNPTGPVYRKVKLRTNICESVVEKTIVFKVAPCIINVSVPDSLMLLTNTSGLLAATANTAGNYKWEVSGPVSLVGENNTQSALVKGTAAGTGWAEVSFTGKECRTSKRIKIVVFDKAEVSIDESNATVSSMCIKDRRIITAKGVPAGGVFNWTLSSNALEFYGGAGNKSSVTIDAASTGNSTVTCTYTVNGQTAMTSFTTKVSGYSKIELVPGNTAKDITAGATVTYTAQAYDLDGRLTTTPPLRWRVVYIPEGQDKNPGNWFIYELPGTGSTQTNTWSLPLQMQTSRGKKTYKLKAWIEATEYCTYRSAMIPVTITGKITDN